MKKMWTFKMHGVLCNVCHLFFTDHIAIKEHERLHKMQRKLHKRLLKD